MARPRYLDREATPIGESFRSILEYLEAHPNQHRDKQWAALLRLRTETAEGTPAPIAAPVAAFEPATAQAEAGGEAGAEAPATHSLSPATPVATTVATPDAATLSRREQALGADLLWLLHQGHVIDFAMGNLQAATRPAPKQPSKKEAAAIAATAAAEAASEMVSTESDHPAVDESVAVTEEVVTADLEEAPKE